MHRVAKEILEAALLQRLKRTAVGDEIAAVKVEALPGSLPNWKIAAVMTAGSQAQANSVAAWVAESTQCEFQLLELML